MIDETIEQKLDVLEWSDPVFFLRPLKLRRMVMIGNKLSDSSSVNAEQISVR
jgi:hypothetical protein